MHLGSEIKKISTLEGGKRISTGKAEVAVQEVLLALGRRPNTDELGLDRAGVITDSSGAILVDHRLRTSN